MIKLFNIKSKTGNSVIKTLAMGKLTKHRAQELFSPTELFGFVVSIVSVNTAFKNIIGCKLNQLGKDHLPLIHGRNFP